MSAWEDVWGLWWLWRAPKGLVGHSQPVEAGPVSTAFGRQLWELVMGVMERSRTGLLKGSVCCGVLHPKALCGLFQALPGEARRELFS